MSFAESLHHENWPIAEPANPSDITDLLTLEKEAFPFEEAWSEDAFRKELELRPDGIKVVRDNKKIVGYVHFQVGYDDILDRRQQDIPSDGVIGSVAVSKEYRGRGVGEYLLRIAIDSLESQGVPRIVANTRSTNTAMLRLCEKVGFSRIGITPDFYGRGQDAVDFELPLS